MAEGSKANVTNPAQPPFGNGKGATEKSGAARGGHDFLKDPKSNSPATGGRDFTKESRSQSEARDECSRNPQEIPAGGKDLYANPGSVSGKMAGSGGAGPNPKAPFKGLK